MPHCSIHERLKASVPEYDLVSLLEIAHEALLSPSSSARIAESMDISDSEIVRLQAVLNVLLNH